MLEESKGDIFAEFKQWSKQQGFLGQDKVDYPHMFGSGENKYPGMVAKKDIKHRECILAVPFD